MCVVFYRGNWFGGDWKLAHPKGDNGEIKKQGGTLTV